MRSTQSELGHLESSQHLLEDREKSRKKLCRIGRSQNLPDAHRLLDSNQTIFW
jgi:hypothetical protein